VSPLLEDFDAFFIETANSVSPNFIPSMVSNVYCYLQHGRELLLWRKHDPKYVKHSIYAQNPTKEVLAIPKCNSCLHDKQTCRGTINHAMPISCCSIMTPSICHGGVCLVK
jgi:hypothetical protein